MKKYLVAFCAFTLITAAINAQTTDNATQNTTTPKNGWHAHKPGYGKFHHGRYAMMKDINLSDAQKQQVKALNEEYRNKVANLEKNDNITLKDYRSQKANLEKERKGKFDNILTQEQKNTIASNRKKMMEKREIMSQKRLDKMKTDLNLTDDQVAKIQDQRKTMMEQSKSIQDNASLSEEQKREKLMELRRSNHNSIDKILTADQLKKRDQMRSDRMKDMKSKWDNKAS